ncbi:rhodanese-like domain-containing protein 15, chloroplastic isoform X2 [Asparagus officinalis]|uniref:rhodanese-like domain-containing protein 15, chloroplastic isoform X2 n=1 Tax=Asparagus officinalis TaxID=4686 RepID=UPI00098E29EA|nr:rhodanese-like domain-containing protein 15, chloroplastic isoform X2 [Asparagus officinalis]
MACFARFSLPALLSPLALKRSLSSIPASFSFSKQLKWSLGTESRCTRILRLMATDASPEESVLRSVPVRVAHELLQAGHRYLDVRTVDEFNAGHPVGATNIPYMFKVGSGMTKNPNFLAEVSSAFDKDDEIIIGCQSGKRSLMAATDLSSTGFTGVTDVAGGFSAWLQNGLPAEQ